MACLVLARVRWVLVGGGGVSVCVSVCTYLRGVCDKLGDVTVRRCRGGGGGGGVLVGGRVG